MKGVAPRRGIPAHDDPDGREFLTGEVRTGVVRHGSAVPSTLAARILALVPGERVRTLERPVSYAVSPDVFTGVDCTLPSGSGRQARGVGTLTCRVALVGGRVLQGSAYTRLTRGTDGRRQSWSHYLARPGSVEVLGRSSVDDLAAGLLAAAADPAHLDPGGAADRTVDVVRWAPGLDGRLPLRAARTRLRWVVTTGDQDALPSAALTTGAGAFRTLRVGLPAGVPAMAAVELCEDVALHDWLLTTLLDRVSRSRLDDPSGSLEPLLPAVEHLLHLWMPAARTDPRLVPLRTGLDRRAGLSRQWDATVARIRDQFSLRTIMLLSAHGPAVGDGTAGR